MTENMQILWIPQTIKVKEDGGMKTLSWHKLYITRKIFRDLKYLNCSI